MSEKDTIEVNTTKSDKINEKIDEGQTKVNKAIDYGKEKVDEKIDDKKDKLNDTIDQGKTIVDRVATDLSRGVDELVDNTKILQQKVNERINNYKKTVVESLDIDLLEDDKNYYIKVATPGVEKGDIEIEAGDYEISIEATFPEITDELDIDDEAELLISEIKSGKCVKNISFANQIDIHKIKAVFNNGMTIITIPKVDTPKHKVTVE